MSIPVNLTLCYFVCCIFVDFALLSPSRIEFVGLRPVVYFKCMLVVGIVFSAAFEQVVTFGLYYFSGETLPVFRQKSWPHSLLSRD